MSVEQLARELDEIRADVIKHARHAFPALAIEDLEDAYGQGTEAALTRSFTNRDELAAYMHTAVKHAAMNVKRSARWSRTDPLHDSVTRDLAGGEDPSQLVLGQHYRELLSEFLSELDDSDRRIAFLHLNPDNDWTARQIARALDLPRPQVEKSLARCRIRLSRFAALTLRPSAMCHRRREDVLEWQATGQMPLALRFHMRHCHACAAMYRDARIAVGSAILPLLPAGALPAAGVGAFARAYRAAGTHPATGKANDALARVRRFAPVGGGGGAVVAAKLAVTTAAVVTVAALHAVTTTSKPAVHAHHPRLAVAHVANADAPALAPVRSVTTAAYTANTRQVARRTLVTSPSTTTTTTSSKVAVAPPPNATSASAHNTQATAASAAGSGSTAAGSASVAPPPVAPESSKSSAHSTNDSSGTSTIAGPPAPGGAPPP